MLWHRNMAINEWGWPLDSGRFEFRLWLDKHHVHGRMNLPLSTEQALPARVNPLMRLE